MWDKLVGLYVAAIVAGFALAFVPASTLISAGVKQILVLIGGVVIIIFAVAIIHLAFKALFNKHS